jgi:hypothetical protein
VKRVRWLLLAVLVVAGVLGPATAAQADCLQKLDFAISEVTTSGCLSTVSGSNPTQYTTSDAIQLNGVPFPALPGGAKYTVTLPANASSGGSIGLGTTSISLAGITVFSGNLGTLSLPAGKQGDEQEVKKLSVPNGVAIKGLKIQGSIAWRMGFASNGTHYATFPLNIELPNVFKTGPEKEAGGASGMAGLRVDLGGVHFDGLKLEVKNVWVGKLKIESVCFSFVPAGGSSATPCEVPSLGGKPFIECATNDNVDRWDGNAVMELPTSSKPKLALFGGVAGGSVSKLGGFADNLGTSLPIAQGVYLTRVGVGLCIQPPPFKLRGVVGVSALPVGGKSALTVNGSVLYTDAIGTQPWSLKLEGEVLVFDKKLGGGSVLIKPTGDIDFNLNAKVDLFSLVSIEGTISGWIQTQYKKFNLDGNIRACIKSACATAETTVSTVGLAGCLDLGRVPYPVYIKHSDWKWYAPWRAHWETRYLLLKAGFGYRWGGSVSLFGGSCDMGSYRATKSAFATAAGVFHLKVAPGTTTLAVRLRGQGGPPNVTVTGPDGTRVSDTGARTLFRPRHYMLVKNSSDGTTDLLLIMPAPGTWTIRQDGGSHALVGITTAPFEAPPSFAATVVNAPNGGGKKIVGMSYALPPGDTLALEEHGGTENQPISNNVVGKTCPAPQRPGGEKAVCAEVPFTPGIGTAGKREIEAVVSRGGIVITRLVIASYEFAGSPMPSKPTHLQLVRQGNDVVVDWSRVAHESDYTLSVKLSDGREFGNTPGPSCRGFLIKGVGSDVGASVELAGLRKDLESGPVAKLDLAPGAQRAGSAGSLPNPICQTDAIK